MKKQKTVNRPRVTFLPARSPSPAVAAAPSDSSCSTGGPNYDVKQVIHEIPRTSDTDKSKLWYSKAEIKMNRMFVQEDLLMGKVKEMIQQKLQAQSPDLSEEELQTRVAQLIKGGNDSIVKFMVSNQETILTEEDQRMMTLVRKLIKEKLIEMDVCSGETEEEAAEQLTSKVNMIMMMPKNRIKEFLTLPIVSKNDGDDDVIATETDSDDDVDGSYSDQHENHSTLPTISSSHPEFNWLVDCNDMWLDIPVDIQEILQVLGYTEELWNNYKTPPQIKYKEWNSLSISEQEAAVQLGFDITTANDIWNATFAIGENDSVTDMDNFDGSYQPTASEEHVMAAIVTDDEEDEKDQRLNGPTKAVESSPQPQPSSKFFNIRSTTAIIATVAIPIVIATLFQLYESKKQQHETYKI